jgi:hypothetical protein
MNKKYFISVSLMAFVIAATLFRHPVLSYEQ